MTMDVDQMIKLAIGEAVVRAIVNEHRAEVCERRVAELEAELASLRRVSASSEAGADK
jgi:hypothetical protein